MNKTDMKVPMSNQMQTLKGFRDFLPEEKRKREYVANKMKQAFETFGFAPIETPTLEYASLLLGKYGDEADKLVYSFDDRGGRQVALRYDQTVPTARVLAQYQNELPRYFRRYQIQNVFRADKPQAGRYREFTQCDCDIFGSSSPLADAEIIAVYYAAFAAVGLTSLKIEINDRQTLLNTLQPYVTDVVSVMSIIQSIDKLDKQTAEEVARELTEKGLANDAAAKAIRSIENAEMSSNLQEIVNITTTLGVPKEALVFNPKIARGLDYYTGVIFEGKIPEYTVGSVGGGGRYDNLISDLSGLVMPAVGFGIGFDRTVEAANQLGLIPSEGTGTQVLVTVFDQACEEMSFNVASQLRQAGIKTELYPGIEDLRKQFKKADQAKIPYVVIIGEAERQQKKFMLKNMQTGNQELLSLQEAIEKLQ
jgi:histidyl-tRNA synthetase